MTDNRSKITLLLGATLIAYLNSLWGAFQYDDYNVIVNYSPVHTWHDWLADLPHGIRPFLKFTYTLNWNIGLGLLGFHLLNLSIHAASALLFYHLGMALVNRQETYPPHETVSPLKSTAFLAALLFALHPVQTEAVTYISGRSTSLMSLFFLGSLYSYHLGNSTKRKTFHHELSPLLFLLAAASKETAVTLPPALLLWEAASPAWPGWRAIIRRQWAHWLILIAVGTAFIFHPRYGWLLGVSVKTRSIGDNILTQINGICYLITRLFLPHRLNIDPELPIISHWSWLVAGETFLLAGMLLFGIFRLRRRPLIGFGLLWFFLQLLPTNSLLPRLDVANERQLYMAGWGLFLIAANGMAIVANTNNNLRRRSLQVAVVTLFLFFAILTILRNHAYRNEIALWEATLRLSPNKARVHNNLGYAYLLAGRNQEACNAFKTAIRLQPDFTKARNNLTDAERYLKQEQLLRLLGIPWNPPYRSE